MLMESSRWIRLHEGNFIIYRPKDIRGIKIIEFVCHWNFSKNRVIIGKCKGKKFRLVPLLIGLVSLRVMTSCSTWLSNSKVDNDATPFVFVLASNATYTNVGGMYLKSRNVVW